MPLSTVLFRLGRLERRGHAERVRNPDDGRSYLIQLTKNGEALLAKARPAFREYAEAVEGRLGSEKVDALRAALDELRRAVAAELESRA
jgi:DNA-binding MarR family transcriptional regulator